MEKLEHSYRVTICGENFQMKSDQPPQVIERIAGFLDFKIKEVSKGAINADKFRLVVLAAMNISGELFDIKNKSEESEKQGYQILEKSRALNESLDRALKPV